VSTLGLTEGDQFVIGRLHSADRSPRIYADERILFKALCSYLLLLSYLMSNPAFGLLHHWNDFDFDVILICFVGSCLKVRFITAKAQTFLTFTTKPAAPASQARLISGFDTSTTLMTSDRCAALLFLLLGNFLLLRVAKRRGKRSELHVPLMASRRLRLLYFTSYTLSSLMGTEIAISTLLICQEL